MSKWIDATQQKPDYWKPVLLCCEANDYPFAVTGFYSHHMWIGDDGSIRKTGSGGVTYWQELPSLPDAYL